MKVLSISMDRKIFEEDSAVRQRALEYGQLVEELKIIIFNSSEKYQVSRIPNTNVWLYPTNSINRWFYIFDAIRIGRKMIGDGRDWVIDTQDVSETGLTGYLISFGTKARLHFQVHTDFLSKYFSKGFALNRIRVIIAKFLLPKADGVRVVSGRIQRSIVGHGLVKNSGKIKILPIFVDLEKIKNARPKFDLHQKYPQFDFIFLVVSRLEKEKNINLVINSFTKVVRKYPKAGLVIVGAGSKTKSLQSTVNSLKLVDNVIFEGWQKDAVSYYKTADLFLSTSNYEGYGMTLIEAGISGCPILTTSVGIVGEVLNEENSLICDIGDEKCFAEKMIYAMRNQELLKEMALKTQQKIEGSLVKDKQRYLEEYKRSWQNCFK